MVKKRKAEPLSKAQAILRLDNRAWLKMGLDDLCGALETATPDERRQLDYRLRMLDVENRIRRIVEEMVPAIIERELKAKP